jgi:hypothetical protein
MPYLFWAQLVCWLGLFIYAFILFRKNQILRKEIEALKGANHKTGQQGAGWHSQGAN